jgi:hypothetical protein
MELLVIGAIILVGGAIWYMTSGKDDSGSTGGGSTTPVEEAPAQAKKAAPAPKPKAEPKPATIKLPAAAKLNAQTKAQLEELGRGLGVELDRRKTKDKMIDDLKVAVRALNKDAKAQLK